MKDRRKDKISVLEYFSIMTFNLISPRIILEISSQPNRRGDKQEKRNIRCHWVAQNLSPYQKRYRNGMVDKLSSVYYIILYQVNWLFYKTVPTISQLIPRFAPQPFSSRRVLWTPLLLCPSVVCICCGIRHLSPPSTANRNECLFKLSR